ncbi:hypothetical protein O181_025411 [Austropuccinia psidii MF-1]|uniref:Chromo domain-containing protein n=1 Tax=Austropuccinia psidii MF-1 TaxID=1389203 RepID=A0A9Q3GZI8_9BASI|nr:hypothetical protein [Austropuccinia psidii MF-1]
MLLSSLRTKNSLVLKRRRGLKNASATNVVERTHLKNASRGLKIGRGPQEASLEIREKPDAKKFILKYSLTISELPEKIPLLILDSNESTSLFIIHYTKWVVELPSFPSFEWDLFIIDSPKGEDLILGYDFLYHFNPIIDWKNGLITYDSSHNDYSGITSSNSNAFATSVNSVAVVGEIKTPFLPPSVHILSIITSQSLLLSRDQVFKEINDVGEDVAISSFHLFQGDMDLPPLSFHASLEEQLDEEEEPEEIETVLKVVPPACHQYLNVFSKVKAEKPPPHHACDHHIKLECLLPPGFIRTSSSSTGAPFLCVEKKDGGLCLCVDYHKLNSVTRKNRYAVPPMNQLLTMFNGSTIFSKIDLCGAYNLLRIKEGDENLTAFRTKYGSYEYWVMSLGLTNAPASFQNLVNDIFAYFLNIFVLLYFDYIMGFSNSEEEDVKHVASVLQRLRENNLFPKASKCVFHASSVEYLGYVVSSEGLKIDSFKVQKILNWPQPNNIKLLQSFLGFANFYCCFIQNYSKKSLLSLPSLKDILPSSSMKKLLTDASDYALGSVMRQVNDSGKTPIAFDSRKPLPAQLKYEIHDKELLGIVWALKCWRAFLLSLSNSFERGVDFISKNPQSFHQVLKKNEIKESKPFPIKAEVFSDLVDQIQKALWQEKDYKEILKQLSRGESISDYSLEPQAKLLLLKNRVVMPSNHEIRLDILQTHHDSPLAGHPGQEKTLKLIKRDFSWAGMNQIIKDYVCSSLKKIGSHVYHLKLPQQWKSVNPVFHVALLEPVKQSTIPNQQPLPPPPVIVKEQEKWEVAQVLDSKLKRGTLWYLVEWKELNEDRERTTWEPASNLTNSPNLVKDFHTLYPDKPGPNSSRV